MDILIIACRGKHMNVANFPLEIGTGLLTPDECSAVAYCSNGSWGELMMCDSDSAYLFPSFSRV